MELKLDDRRFIARLANLISQSGVILCIGNEETTLWSQGQRGEPMTRERVRLEEYNLNPELIQYRASMYPKFFSVLTPSPASKERALRINLTIMGERIASRIMHLDPIDDVIGFKLLGLDEPTVYDLLQAPLKEPAPRYALLAWDKLTDTTITATTQTRQQASYDKNRKLIAARVVSGDGGDMTLYTPLSIECTGSLLISKSFKHEAYSVAQDNVSREVAQAVARQTRHYDGLSFTEQCADASRIQDDLVLKAEGRTPEIEM